MNKSKLIFFTGKMGAGKSTYAMSLASKGYIVISEDKWLQSLYPGEVKNMQDYIKYSRRLKETLKPLIVELLNKDCKVCLDFPGNTKKQRAWFKTMIAETNVSHRLIYLKTTDALCIKRLAQRVKLEPERALFDNEKVFYQVSKYFEEPSLEEGFELDVIEQGETNG